MTETSTPRAFKPLILIGPTPPPVHGSSFATKHLIEAVDAAGLLAGHLETGEDERPIFATGAFDPINVYLGIKHVLLLLVMLIRNPGAEVHVPISQNRWGFTRDGVFIWLAWAFRRDVIVHLYGGLFGDFYASSGAVQRRLIASTFGRVTEALVESRNRLTVFDGLLAPEQVRILENTAEDQLAAGSEDSVNERSPAGRLNLLFLSHLFPEKGHPDLLAALELLAERGSSGFDLRLVGDVEPAEAERIRARAERLATAGIGIEHFDTALGDVKRAHYEWADALVLPSKYPPEGQPLVIIEAMSAGIPVVASNHSGIPYTVLDGEQGLIFPKGDVEALAAAIESLRVDLELRNRLGTAGRKRFETMYASDAYRARVAEILATR